MVPKKKQSRSETRQRRAHDALTPATYMDCPRCNQPKLSHAACSNCGFVRPGLRIAVGKE